MEEGKSEGGAGEKIKTGAGEQMLDCGCSPGPEAKGAEGEISEGEIFKKIIDKYGVILYIVHVAYRMYAALAQ